MSCKQKLFGVFAAALIAFSVLSPYVSAAEDPVIGRTTQYVERGEAECLESPLGDIAADAVRESLRADAALIPAGLLSGWLPAGEQSLSGVEAAFTGDAELVIYSLSFEQLASLAEKSVSRITIGPDDKIDREASGWDGFLQVSGMSFRYDASALPGGRLLELDIAGQEPFKVACPSLPAAYDELLPDGVPAGKTLYECLQEYFSCQNEVDVPEERRIEVVGTVDETLYSRYVPFGLLVLVTILVSAAHFIYRRHNEDEEF